MPTLTITRGYPASGKTTWANAQPNTKRISRDGIRFDVLFIPEAQGLGTSEQEDRVSEIHVALVTELLELEQNVIVDDMNLHPSAVRRWAALSMKTSASFRVVLFATDVEECVRRNQTRASAGGRYVPEDVIRKIATKYPYPFPSWR